MKRLIIIAMLPLFLTGCALFALFAEDEDDETAQSLAWSGMDDYESGDYEGAKESFEKLKDWYPYSDYAKLAELKIADANYKLRNYEEAVFAYEEFESLHPRNEAIPYVIYMTGMCYFEQIDTPDRDQSTAQKALETFGRLQRDHPNDPYTIKAQEHINACLRSLAMAELSIGRFYYKSKHYKAAMRRFKNVLTRYPDVGIHQEALKLIAKTEASLAKSSQAGESILPFF
ncbi:MAG: outer membrane protein assembly factor BamD [Desulfobacterales bacterium]|nr:outer membrane protein assembly factor BamD [Desulfobacterales bacterium]MDJ0888422.1 outer membrane protein assembly factor BamD [Desulfobacterales bacterium]